MDMNDQAIQAMAKAIADTISSASLPSSAYIKKGRITETLNNNRYKMFAAGESVTVRAFVGQSYEINDTVIVLCQNGNNAERFILGKVA